MVQSVRDITAEFFMKSDLINESYEDMGLCEASCGYCGARKTHKFIITINGVRFEDHLCDVCDEVEIEHIRKFHLRKDSENPG